jgi:glycosyltransferase involved in cell wall biosynthesis
MKIVQVSTLYPPDLFSGGTLACHNVARGLKARGHDVSVYSGSCLLGEGALTEREWTYEGVPVRAINVTSGYAQGTSNYRNASVAERFDRYVAAARPDVVHFHSIQALGADVLAVPRAHGAATVLSMHDAWFVCPRQFVFTGPPANRMCPLRVDAGACDCIAGFDFVERRQFLDATLQHVDRVLAVSEPFADLLRDNGVPREKIVVCENGLVAAAPLPRTPSRRVRFGHVGVPDAWKGTRTIARAMALLEDDVVLEIHGLDAGAWRALGGSWPDRRVAFRPRFGPADLPSIMANLDVVLVTSIGVESFSIVTREAMQYGLPVIASRCLGPEAAVRDGDNGLLFERGDARGLAEAMHRFARDPGFLSRASAAAAATRVRSIDEQLSQIEEIYETVRRPDAARGAPLPASVLFIAGMDGAPYRYRVEHLVGELRLLGVHATARFQNDEEALVLAGEHDVVVLNRVAFTPHVERIIARARAAGAVLVFGVDDLIFDPDLQIEALGGLSKDVARSYRRGLALFRRTLRRCDAFLGSTPVLADAASAGCKHVFVHPNMLSGELLTISERARQREVASRAARRDARLRVGYFSGSHAHDRDFEVAADAVAAVLADRPDVILVLGGYLRVPDVLAPFAERIERLPFMGWRELPAALARLDVNIAPLVTPSIFNDAKSVLKWFEAAAVGVPTIAAATAPYHAAIRHGENGMLAEGREQWEAALRALLDDAALRARIGDAARAEVRASYGPERGAQLLGETMRQIYALAKGPLKPLPALTAAELRALRESRIGLGRPAMEPTDLDAGPAQLASDAVTPPLGERVVAHQPLFLPDGFLERVDLLVGTYGRMHRHDLLLRLVDLATGKELARTVVPAEHAADNCWLAFELGGVPTRAGRQVAIIVEAAGLRGRSRSLSIYCHRAGWPSGVASCGMLTAMNLTYRTWMRPTSARPDDPDDRRRLDQGPGATSRAALERRLAAAEERLAHVLARPGRLEERARTTAPWRAAERLRELLGEPGPSVPFRIVRKGLAIMSPSAPPEEIGRRMERVRSTLPYRVGRSVYRALRRR